LKVETHTYAIHRSPLTPSLFTDSKTRCLEREHSPASCRRQQVPPLPFLLSVATTKKIAVRDWVIFAKLRGFSHVMMEMDSLEVVNLDLVFASYILIVVWWHQSCMNLGSIVLVLNLFSIKHIMRSANNSFHLYVLSSLALWSWRVVGWMKVVLLFL
jgi:hypothetical protein